MKKSVPKVSVIIPVYNAEKTIEKCCNALFAQTLQDMEFIFVDDCSTDRTIDIIRSFGDKELKKRTRIISQSQNMGVSAARQNGLEHANGEYVIHCDSDDWPEPDMYEKLYKKAIDEQADIVCCDYVADYKTESIVYRFPDNSIGNPSFCIKPIEGAVWNKLIKRTLFVDNNISFPIGVNLGEDFVVVTSARVVAKRETVLHEPLYHYNQMNVSSITHNYTRERFIEVLKLAKELEFFLKNNGLYALYMQQLMYLQFQVKSFFIIYPHVRDLTFWKKTYPESNKYIWQYQNTPFNMKLIAWLISKGFEKTARYLLSIKDSMN